MVIVLIYMLIPVCNHILIKCNITDTKKRRFLWGLRRMFRRRSARNEQEVREPAGTPGPPTTRGRTANNQLLTDDESPKRKSVSIIKYHQRCTQSFGSRFPSLQETAVRIECFPRLGVHGRSFRRRFGRWEITSETTPFDGQGRAGEISAFKTRKSAVRSVRGKSLTIKRLIARNARFVYVCEKCQQRQRSWRMAE